MVPTFAVVALGERRTMIRSLAGDLFGQVTSLLVVDNRADLGTLDLPAAIWLANSNGQLHAGWNRGLDVARDLAVASGAERWATLVLNDDVRIAAGAVQRLVAGLDADGRIWATYPDFTGLTTPQRPVAVTTGDSPTGRSHTGWCVCHRGERRMRYEESYEFWFGDDQIECDIRRRGGHVAAVHDVRVVHLEPDVAVQRSPELQAAVDRDRQRFFAANPRPGADSSSVTRRSSTSS